MPVSIHYFQVNGTIYEYCPQFNPIVHKYLPESSQKDINVPDFTPSLAQRAMNTVRFSPLLLHKHKAMNIARVPHIPWYKHKEMNIARVPALHWYKPPKYAA